MNKPPLKDKNASHSNTSLKKQIKKQAWHEIELTFTALQSHDRPYENVDMWAQFKHTNGTILKRPAFYDGDSTWKIRFASPLAEGSWNYTTFTNIPDEGLANQTGTIACTPNTDLSNIFYTHGFWHIPSGKRTIRHADGTPSLLIGDTAWAIPFRATLEECEIYAQNRQKKGFNAALLMTVQPDLNAKGPRNRTEDFSFEVAFEDLPNKHINEINISYFQYLDKLIDTLVSHEICPVYQPLFHGYGWKGGGVIGTEVSSEEYMRYMRYLIARYGARPAIYLIGADGNGYYESINDAGHETEEWDCYEQPTGIHYCPHADNKAWQSEKWLDFQWCQTGHTGLHIPERVASMWRNDPPKAVANGEPTYEHIGEEGRAGGWWQGEEAIRNLCAGGTMGVVYGAGSLWQWKRSKDEPGHERWAHAKGHSWLDALDFEGSDYVGALSKIFKDQPFSEMEPNWTYAIAILGLAIPNTFYLAYLPKGGAISLTQPEAVPVNYKVYDLKTGNIISSGTREQKQRNVDLKKTENSIIVIFS